MKGVELAIISGASALKRRRIQSRLSFCGACPRGDDTALLVPATAPFTTRTGIRFVLTRIGARTASIGDRFLHSNRIPLGGSAVAWLLLPGIECRRRWPARRMKFDV